MSKYLTAGNVSAVLSVLAIMVGAFGKNALSTFLNDPSTTQSIMVIIGAVGTLIAGALPGIKQIEEDL
jgi:hypothetical protein